MKTILTDGNLSVEAELCDDVLWNVSLDGLFDLTLGGLQQPIELLRVKLLQTQQSTQRLTGRQDKIQEIWANAQEMRDSISAISYSSCPGLSLVYFSKNSVFECESQPKIAKKFTKNLCFGGSRSFKVIDVCTTGKLVSSACYDKQQVCVYLQPLSW